MFRALFKSFSRVPVFHKETGAGAEAAKSPGKETTQ